MLQSRLFNAIVVAGAALGAISACSDPRGEVSTSPSAHHDGGSSSKPSDDAEASVGGGAPSPDDAATDLEDAAERDGGGKDAGHMGMHDASLDLDDEDGGWPPTK